MADTPIPAATKRRAVVAPDKLVRCYRIFHICNRDTAIGAASSDILHIIGDRKACYTTTAFAMC